MLTDSEGYAFDVIYTDGAATVILPAKAAEQAESYGQIREMTEQIMKRGNIPSTSEVIVDGENLEYISYGENINEHSLFLIGSLSKSYTGLGTGKPAYRSVCISSFISSCSGKQRSDAL